MQLALNYVEKQKPKRMIIVLLEKTEKKVWVDSSLSAAWP